MSNYRQLYPPPRTCRSETEIRNLFDRHMKALTDQKWKMVNEITEWGNNVIRQIQENVIKQKTVLEQEYKNQAYYLQTTCQEFLDTALIYEERKDREEVRRLLEQCHALKFQLGSFEYPEQCIPFIQVQKEKQDASDTFKYKNIPVSTSSKSTFANSNQINQQKLTTTSSIAHGRFSTGNGTPNSNVMVDKCPACFMIFPSTMGTHERSQHVNQHFGDS